MAENHNHSPDPMDYQSKPHGASLKNDRKWTRSDVCCVQMLAVVIFAVGIAGGIVIGIYALKDVNDDDDVKCPSTTPCMEQQNIHQQGSTSGPPTRTDQPINMQSDECPNRNPVSDTPYEDKVFAPLTTAEMEKAANTLMQQNIISILTQPRSLTENFILYQSLFPPNKQEALQYLDNGGEKPKRYSKVTVQRGKEASPDVMEYKVGPLDSQAITVAAITGPGDIPFNARPYDVIEVYVMEEILADDLGKTLAPLIAESFDGAKYPEDLFVNFYNGPPSTTGNTRRTRWNIGLTGFDVPNDVDLLHLLPLSGVVYNAGTNFSEWFAYDFYYLNQGPFKTAADLMAAYNNNTIRKVSVTNGYKDTVIDRIFPSRDTSQKFRRHARKQGPTTYRPTGPRFDIDGTSVKWMDWEFEISGGQIRGPAIFNINLKNERIIYELAVNDIALNYAMDSHAQNNIIYADATYGIMNGETPTTIMKGVDCPEHGTVLNTSYWLHGTQKAYNMKSICVFEADGQEALWRHVGVGFEAGLRNRYLVVRSPVVIGNYDYTFEFHFYLDGKVYTFAKASGYIQSSFWDEHNPNTNDRSRDAFGYRLNDYQTGPVHDHMFGFKVDMDIIDDKNTMQIVNWKAGPVLEALQTQVNITQTPSYFIYNETRYIDWEIMKREQALTDEHQQFWLVVNEKEKNKWGVERGYQIAPLATGSQALKTHPLLKALSFTKYHCAVTLRKEEEPTVTSIYDINRMESPKLHLDGMLNNEDIVNKDIVNWVTVGFLHIPTTEDFPMTVRVETGFLIRPFNFFDKTATFDMPQHTEKRDKTLKESEPKANQCFAPKYEYCRFC